MNPETVSDVVVATLQARRLALSAVLVPLMLCVVILVHPVGRVGAVELALTAAYAMKRSPI